MRHQKKKGVSRMNIQKLKGKIVEHGLNVGSLAEMIGIDRSSLYRKLNKGENITCGEAIRIMKALDISNEEAILIFLR